MTDKMVDIHVYIKIIDPVAMLMESLFCKWVILPHIIPAHSLIPASSELKLHQNVLVHSNLIALLSDTFVEGLWQA